MEILSIFQEKLPTSNEKKFYMVIYLQNSFLWSSK